MSNHLPATPLPWAPWTKRVHHEILGDNRDVVVAEVRQCSGPHGSTVSDAAYIAHAANAYPKLVAQLRALISVGPSKGGEGDNARALLRELGE